MAPLDPPIDFGEPLSLEKQLARAVAAAGDRTALVSRSGRLCFRELDQLANRAAGALAELGVKPGDRVAVSLPNGSDIVAALFGCWKLGGIFTGVHRVLAAPEKAYMLDDCGARLLLADPENARQAAEDARLRPALTRIVEVDPEAPEDEWRALLAEASDAAPERGADPLACAAIAYTSGTTGRPKGVMHSQHNALLVGACAVARGNFGPEDTDLAILPMTILNLMVIHPLTAIQSLAKLVVTDRHDPASLARWIRDEEVVHISVVPTVMHELLTSPDVADDDLRTLRKPRTGGASMPEAVKTRFQQRFGFRPATSFALTEGPNQVARQEVGDPSAEGSCGRPLPHIEVAVLDERGQPCPPDVVGEICFGPKQSGPWAGVYRTMLGYWGQPDETARALRDGRVHSGDMGRFDADGQLFIVDRKKELIIRGGSNIYPAEIERVLLADPRVAECVVVPKPDEKYGELLVACVQPVEEGAVAAAELLALCASQLASYKVPSEIRFVTSFPRSALGKIARARVRASAQAGDGS
jgi:acyl-CoA synthetase (AMP-forming)/AMP-acid ligase II